MYIYIYIYNIHTKVDPLCVTGGGGVKVGGVSLIFILSNLFQCYLSEYLVCVCVLFIYTVSISIVCVSREELTLIESN